jgi:hypothetical protein
MGLIDLLQYQLQAVHFSLDIVGLASLETDLMVLYFFCDFFLGMRVAKGLKRSLRGVDVGLVLLSGLESRQIHHDPVGVDSLTVEGATTARWALFPLCSIPAYIEHSMKLLGRGVFETVQRDLGWCTTSYHSRGLRSCWNGLYRHIRNASKERRSPSSVQSFHRFATFQIKYSAYYDFYLYCECRPWPSGQGGHTLLPLGRGGFDPRQLRRTKRACIPPLAICNEA